MGIFDFMRRRRWDLASLPNPSGALPSIHAHIEAHLDAVHGTLPDAYALPDAQPGASVTALRWAAGARDAVFGAPGRPAARARRARALLHAIDALVNDATEENLQRLHALAIREPVLSVLEEVVRGIAKEAPAPHAERVHALGRYLIEHAGHREAVKLGIALLSAVGTSDDVPALMTLGACDEFTFFAAVALLRSGHDKAAAHARLLMLAQRVRGWGRVRVVALLDATALPEARAWLLREGHRNTVGEDVALTCARTGCLADALAERVIDDALLRSASDLLDALLPHAPGDPARIDDLADGSRAISSYLGHLLRRGAGEPRHLATTRRLRAYLLDPSDGKLRLDRGWDDARRDHCLQIISEILAGSDVTQRDAPAHDVHDGSSP